MFLVWQTKTIWKKLLKCLNFRLKNSFLERTSNENISDTITGIKTKWTAPETWTQPNYFLSTSAICIKISKKSKNFILMKNFDVKRIFIYYVESVRAIQNVLKYNNN